MAILSLLVTTLIHILTFLTSAYKLILIARALISWVNADPYNPIVRFVYQLTEPLLARVRRLSPLALTRLPIDLSPLLIFILLIVIETFIVGLLHQMLLNLGPVNP